MNKLQLFIGKLLYNLWWKCIPRKEKIKHSGKRRLEYIPDFHQWDYYKTWEERAEPVGLSNNQLFDLFILRVYQEIDAESKTKLGRFKSFYESLNKEQQHNFWKAFVDLE